MNIVVTMQWIFLAFSIVIWLILNWSLMRQRRKLRRLTDAMEPLMQGLTEAQDPGREIHERLARAFEASMIKTDGPAKPDPAGRRVAAMALAQDFMHVVDSAKLKLVDARPDSDED